MRRGEINRDKPEMRALKESANLTFQSEARRPVRAMSLRGLLRRCPIWGSAFRTHSIDGAVSSAPEAFRQRLCSKLQAPLGPAPRPLVEFVLNRSSFPDSRFAGPEHGHRTDPAMFIGTQLA